MGNANFLKKGCWNVICHRCGGKFKSDKIFLEWDNLLVCRDCFEVRHPQDFTQGYIDKQTVPFSSPEMPDKFVE